MSQMTNIQSINVPFEISADNGNTWETLVCISDHKLPVSSAVNKVNTQCGVAVGLGPVEFNPSGSAVNDITETVPGQVSYKDVLAWTVNQTRLKFRAQQSSGSGSIGDLYYLSGFGYFTACEKDDTVGDVEKFTFTFSGIGTPSLTPGT